MKSILKLFKIIMSFLIISFTIFITSSYAYDEVIETDDGEFYIGDYSSEDYESESEGYELDTNFYNTSIYGVMTLSDSTYTVTDTITGVLSGDTLTLTGIGDMPDYSKSTDVPWGGNTSIKKLIVSSGITSIGKYNFVNLTSLTSVSLPSSITSIGEGAFYGCSNLTSFTVPSGVTEIIKGAFAECTSLESITLNEGLETIGQYAFQNTVLKTLTIPSTVTDISSEFTYGVTTITEYKVASGNDIYFAEEGALCEDLPNYTNVYLLAYPTANTAEIFEIPERVNDIAQRAFENNQYLKKIIIHDGVEAIRAYSFSKCQSLEEIVIGECDLFFFGPSVFYDCPNLKTVEFGAILTNTYYPVDLLQYGTFKDCVSLETVNFTGEVGEIYSNAFENCTSLKTITLSKTTRIIDSNAFLNCTSLEEVVWNDTIEAVHQNAFSGCNNLKETYPEGFELSSDGYYRKEAIDVKITGTYYYTMAKQVLDLVNQERAKQGLSSLYMDEALFETAQQRAAEIAVLFEHDRPNGTDCFDIFPSGNSVRAENIAAGQTSAQSVMNSWMNSSGHKANILNSSVKSIGIACFYHNGTYYWVQCFGTTGTEKTSYASNETKQVTVQVTYDNVTFSLSSTSLSIDLKDTDKVIVYGKYSGSSRLFICDNDTFTWLSSNSSLFTVDSKGVVTGKSCGSGTLKMTAPNGQTFSISVTIKLPFSDVSTSAWYYEAVEYCYTNEIILGYEDSTFRPGNNITRGQLVTILWRMEGEPDPTSSKSPYSDLSSSSYYYDAVLWAAENGVVNGFDDGTFKSGNIITRQQFAVILRNFSDYKGLDTSKLSSLSSFADSSEVSSYALTAMQWAVENKVINGSTSGGKKYLNPQGSATRAEASGMIYNYCTQVLNY